MTNLLALRMDTDALRDQLEQAQVLAGQLQRALDSRVVVEQAKAFVASDRGVSVDEAFEVIRTYSRSNNVKLQDVAGAIVEGFRP